VVYILDITQTKHALRRNYPVIGHFRYFFDEVGKFFRQYFFAMDREEMPFNRAERSWVYRAAKDLDNTTAFGSTRNLTASGTILFVNCPFPTLGCIQALQCNKNTCPTGITTHNPRLQKGLVPTVKSERVANYVKNMVHEVGVIAHSCGVREPRQLRRFHARIVTENRHSVSLEEMYAAHAAQSKQNEINKQS